MKSGLEGRNNVSTIYIDGARPWVSMKSGLEGRNNPKRCLLIRGIDSVSMKSGLEGRNNSSSIKAMALAPISLNEVRPRRPEQ